MKTTHAHTHTHTHTHTFAGTKDVANSQALQLFVGEVNAHLLQTVVLEHLKPEDVEDAHPERCLLACTCVTQALVAL